MGVCVCVMGVLVFRETGKENNTCISSQPSRHHCMVKECGFSQTFFFFIVRKHLDFLVLGKASITQALLSSYH